MTQELARVLRPPTTVDWKRLRLRRVRPTPARLAIANKKGGSGKTTTAIQLAAAFAAWGAQVRLSDGDPQKASATYWLPPQTGGEAMNTLLDVFMGDASLDDATYATTVDGLWIVPSLSELARVEIERPPGTDLLMAAEFRDSEVDIDLDLMDAAPSMGLVTVSLLGGATHVLIAMRASTLDHVGSSEITKPLDLVIKRLNPDLLVSTILLVAAQENTILLRQLRARVAKDYPGALIAITPNAVKTAEAPGSHQPMIDYAPDNPVTHAYWELAARMAPQLGFEWEIGPDDVEGIAWPVK